MRSVESGWKRGSIIAVDAGVHLGAITNILEATQPKGLGETEELSLPHTLTSGPFAGLEVPYAKASSNASHIHGALIDTYLITHPHLDHISGFVINTAGLPGNRPKRLAGLPSTIAAFKAHIFNNVIWPNLSDENNGAGLVTYMRLVEGGSPALGDGDNKGYIEVSDGLSVKTWGVSHGHCIERHTHRGSGSVRPGSFDGSLFGPHAIGMGASLLSPRAFAHHNSSQQARDQQSPNHTSAAPATTGNSARSDSISAHSSTGESVCVYDSSAYFIRDVTTGREILVFGDVEPDSVSLSPRNQQVWTEAAPKIASGKLAAIFLESSYDDSQSVDRLFGHLTPRFIAEEMASLASEVTVYHAAVRQGRMQGSSASGYGSGSEKKRKRQGSDGGALLARRKPSQQSPSVTSNPSISRTHTGESGESPISPKTVKAGHPPGIDTTKRYDSLPTASPNVETPHLATPTALMTLQDVEMTTNPNDSGPPLKGLKVVVIHVKDKLNDGPAAGDVILEQLRAHEAEAGLGVEYILSSVGQDLYL